MSNEIFYPQITQITQIFAAPPALESNFTERQPGAGNGFRFV